MISRAIHLIDMSRYDLAEKELQKILSQNPDDYTAHAYLGLCQYHLDRHEEAQQSAQTAIRLLPDHPFGHYILGIIMMGLKKLKEAKASFLEAIRFDPEEAQYYGMLGYVYIGSEQWQEALDHANKGLSLDPTNMTCKNCRASALTHLGRMEEAHETIQDALKENPEDAHTFANLGWTYLHKGQHKQALEYFKEALRLDPEYEWARNGMIQSLKANYVVYKLLLMFYLWMLRLSPKVRTGVIIGIFVLFRITRIVARENPELSPFLIPIIGLYLAFVYLTWTGTHFFNTLLRFNKFGRCVLNDRERKASNCYAALVIIGIGSAVAGVITDQFALLLFGGLSFLMTLPVCHLFDKSEEGLDRTTLLFCIGLALLGIAGVVLTALGYKEIAGGCGSFFIILFAVFTWSGVLRRSSREKI